MQIVLTISYIKHQPILHGILNKNPGKPYITDTISPYHTIPLFIPFFFPSWNKERKARTKQESKTSYYLIQNKYRNYKTWILSGGSRYGTILWIRAQWTFKTLFLPPFHSSGGEEKKSGNKCSVPYRLVIFFHFWKNKLIKTVNKNLLIILSALDTFFRLSLFSHHSNFFKGTMSVSSEANTPQTVSPIEFPLVDLVFRKKGCSICPSLSPYALSQEIWTGQS